jgi:hypothetical protein
MSVAWSRICVLIGHINSHEVIIQEVHHNRKDSLCTYTNYTLRFTQETPKYGNYRKPFHSVLYLTLNLVQVVSRVGESWL